MPYDIVLLSCEGGETYDANPPALESYLNAGGRVFASHFHYAWFAGALVSAQGYTAPPDWGISLASWSAVSSGNQTADGIIVQTLNGSSSPFLKGTAFFQWLGDNGALGTGAEGGAPVMELPIAGARFSASVASTNTPSQSWIQDDSSSMTSFPTAYFTFDTPVSGPDGGAPTSCGRAGFGDLHVESTQLDTLPTPTGCVSTSLSPQEKALEFMIFDSSSCVLPDSVPPSDGGLP